MGAGARAQIENGILVGFKEGAGIGQLGLSNDKFADHEVRGPTFEGAATKRGFRAT